jgi:hypothetical protein
MRVATPDQVTGAENAAIMADKQAVDALMGANEQQLTALGEYIRSQFDLMKRHRMSANGWDSRLIRALRMFNGEYDPDVLAEIEKFGGSRIYARIVSVKCRGATSLLRDIYLTGAKSWSVEPTPDPELPDSITDKIDQLIAVEAQTVMLAGKMGIGPDGTINPFPAPPAPPAPPAAPSGPIGGMRAPADSGMGTNPAPNSAPNPVPNPEGPSIDEINERRRVLMAEARIAARKRARQEAAEHERVLDDYLVEGGFYDALAEVLSDLPLFPFAVLKGPVVRIVPTIKWVDRKAVQVNVPQMQWERVSPFDFWWLPGSTDIRYTNTIELIRYHRTELNALLGLPGYDEDAIRSVLQDYANGYTEDCMLGTQEIQAGLENRESPSSNETGLIDCLLFTGNVQGRVLREHGWSHKKIKDPDRDYSVQVWMIGRHIIKIQMNPSPSNRNPYYVTSFEKVPGTLVGNALPDILADIQETCNATLRSLNNNMALSSGPQVIVNEDMLSDDEDGDSFYPWKRWKVTLPQNGMAAGNNQRPVDFFQPNSNAQILLAVYEKFTQMADELSAIPRYITGSDRMGGAGRTASGLAMLMSNASKILQTVAANIDNDIIKPVVHQLHELVVLTDKEGRFRGDERITVKGVAVAIQKETERQRAIELLQATTNPMDAAIMGMRGRAVLLRQVAEAIGMEGETMIPPDEELERREKMQQEAAAMTAQGGPGGSGGAPGGPVKPPKGVGVDNAAPPAPPAPKPGEPVSPGGVTNVVQ